MVVICCPLYFLEVASNSYKLPLYDNHYCRTTLDIIDIGINMPALILVSAISSVKGDFRVKYTFTYLCAPTTTGIVQFTVQAKPSLSGQYKRV